MSRILLSAPYIGEIGWELMSWQARVRWAFARGGFDRVLVLGAPGKDGFYAGMPLEYRPVDLGHLPGAAYEDRRLNTSSGQAVAADVVRECVRPMVEATAGEFAARGDEVEILWPGYDGTLWPCDANHQQFVRYERPVTERTEAPWVVLVERTRAFRDGVNWPSGHWRELERLLNQRGVRTTVYPCEAKAAIDMLSGCDLAIGQSTGGLHLASLCGCPTMVWSLQQYLMWRWEITNRQRYETWWNPLGSPVLFHELKELPNPDIAAQQVMDALHAIGRRTGSAIQQKLFKLKWSLRSLMNEAVIRPRRYARWPWPVQRLVRYQLG